LILIKITRIKKVFRQFIVYFIVFFNILIARISKRKKLVKQKEIMDIGVSILGSGSNGNSILLHSGKDAVMIDAGFSRAEILRRIMILKMDLSMIKGLVLSHEHTDHCKGARVFADNLGIPVYATKSTFYHLERKSNLPKNCIIFEAGAEFSIADFSIRTFSVPHDAEETVGFIVSRGGIKIAIATDLGYLTALCEQRMKGANAIILESNHDVEMQLKSNRKPMLIRRVLGRNGHLSNDSAAEAFPKIITEETKHVFLVHLSRECNNYEIVEKTARQKLADMRRENILLKIATQEPLSTIYIEK